MQKFILLFSILFPFMGHSLSEFKRNPIVYGISPLYLSLGYDIKGLEAVRRRLPEIKELGINIIWLQPITPPFEEDGHGYDVIDYEKVWETLGSEADLKRLVSDAHKLGIKVMLDMVLNHTSFEHPFVKDIVQKGKASKYYEYFQHGPIKGVPYDHHFQVRRIGETDFIHYFWEHLLNLNFDHPPLREYLLKVLRLWVTKYDIDGYRFDASWGPSSRWPGFYPTIAKELRSIKPDIILMAEDMAGYPAAYAGSGHPHLKGSGFDWAYDWNNEDKYWISKWSFQLEDDASVSVFNLDDPTSAAQEFVKALKYSHSEDGIKTVRYIENNDTHGFLKHHSLKQLIWASKIMFVLPGVPLVFYGQETGNKHEVFELPSFDPKKKMKSYRPSIWRLYSRLIKLRRSSTALSEGSLERLKRTGSQVSFLRKYKDQEIKVELDFVKYSVKLNGEVLK